MVTIRNCLDLYDTTIIDALKTKFVTVDVGNRWVICPADLNLHYSVEKFDQRLFPMYSVFRTLPPIKNEAGSRAAYRDDYNLDETMSMKQILIDLNYQVDFWSRSMFEVNQSVIDWFRFTKDPQLTFDFREVGITQLTENMECPIVFEDPQDVSAIDDIYNIGRYFRYSYSFKMTALLFDLVEEVKLDKIVLGLYQDDDEEIHKLFEKEIDVGE